MRSYWLLTVEKRLLQWKRIEKAEVSTPKMILKRGKGFEDAELLLKTRSLTTYCSQIS